MKINKKYFGLLLSFFVCFSCAKVQTDQSKNDELPNAIYMEGVSLSPVKKILVDENDVIVPLSARSANLLDEYSKVKFVVDKSVLDEYNKTYGKFYKMLPDSCYTLRSDESIILTNNYSCTPVDLVINKNSNNLNPSTKYAVAVRVEDEGKCLPVLKNSSYKIIVLDRLYKTSAYHQIPGMYLHYSFPEQMNMNDWTFHYAMKIDRMIDNQQPAMGPWYSRITSVGNLQYKAAGSDDPLAFSKQRLEVDKWYFVTFTYKNQHVKMYLNGILETEFDVVSDSEKWTRIQVSWGNFKGYIRDIRVYNKSLSVDQIQDNLYVEDVNNPDLLMYLPLSKETGLKFTKSPFHNEDGSLPSIGCYKQGSSDKEVYPFENVEWDETLSFPEK